jgi:alpha-tubulin suppressor-like RCC1 family protein
MFGLPTHRTKTPPSGHKCPDTSPSETGYDPATDRSSVGCNDKCPNQIKSAIRLAEMRDNHYSVVIAQDYKNMRGWGGLAADGLGIANTNTPTLIFPNWVGPKEEIVWVRSQEGWSIFRTLQGSVYAFGSNYNSIFGSTYSNTGKFELALTNVIWMQIAGGIARGNAGEGVLTNVYVKNDGSVHGLGNARPSGFGAITTSLTTDGASNDLGIGDAKKCWVQLFDNNDQNTKTFVLKNDGTLWACGYNAGGALGVGSSSTHVTSWMQVIDSAGNPLKNVQNVITSALYQNTTCILADKKIYSCGQNTRGGLGLGLASSATRNSATQLLNIASANLIEGAYFYSSFLASTDSNEVYTWGNNGHGECGVGVAAGTDVNTATKVTTIPTDEKVIWAHGGGSYNMCQGAFSLVRDGGSVYVAGYNHTYALGIPSKNNQNIINFMRNDYFGFGSPILLEPWRFPISVNGNYFTTGTNIISGIAPIDYQDKNVTVPGLPTVAERVYVNKGYYVSGPGVQYQTQVTYVDVSANMIFIDKPVLAGGSNVTLTYHSYPKAVQCDICGYSGEMAMKVVTVNGDCSGTMYQCGWNQLVNGKYNFNPNPFKPDGTKFDNDGQQVDLPTAFEMQF